MREIPMRSIAVMLKSPTVALNRRQAGYALIAALILVVLVSLATSIAAQYARLQAQREREHELLFVGEQFRAAIIRYNAVPGANGAHEYPKTLGDLLEDHRQLVTVRHLRRLYRDPMTGAADWVLELQGDRIIGVHSRSDRTPLIHSGFSNLESQFASARNYADWRFLATQSDSAGAQQTAANMPTDNSPDTVGGPGPGGVSQAPPFSPTQVSIANQCFQNFVVPQADCADEPPPYGKDQYTCVQHFQALLASCMTAWPSANASPTMTN